MLIIILLGSCRTEKSEQEHSESNEQKQKASETFLPTTFRFSIGGMIGRHTWMWDGEELRYEASEPHGMPRITKIVTPSAEQLRAFWERMEEVKVWEWRARYEPNEIVFDGGSWSLELEYGGKAIRSSGNNAYPSDFGKFREAVGGLVGKETFP